MKGFGPAGSYSRKIKYDIKMEQIVAIINQSQRCEQFIKYECIHAVLWFSMQVGWWVSRNGTRMMYWGGAKPGSSSCACGMNNSCHINNKRCNCDTNDNTWREDSGYLVDKSTIPVSELRFGDTWSSSIGYEIGYHTLGKLQCWGL